MAPSKIHVGMGEGVVTGVERVPVVALPHFPQVRRRADGETRTPMSGAAGGAMPLGVWLLASVDKNTIVTGVSAIIVAFVVLMWSGRKYTGGRSPVMAVTVGAVLAAMMAATSVGGSPVLLYLEMGHDPHWVNRAYIITS